MSLVQQHGAATHEYGVGKRNGQAPRTGAHGQQGAPARSSTDVRDRASARPRLPLQNVRRLLCIGVHCEDLERGAGGTIARIISESPGIEVWWIVLSCERPGQARKGRRAAKLFLDGAAKAKIVLHGFREGFLQFQGEQVREAFDELAAAVAPDLVICRRDSANLDCRLTSNMTWETFCDSAIFEYEVFKGCSLQRPNFYVPLDEDECRTKIDRLRSVYGIYSLSHVRSDDVLWSLMRLRGAECGEARFAEAFHTRRMIGG